MEAGAFAGAPPAAVEEQQIPPTQPEQAPEQPETGQQQGGEQQGQAPAENDVLSRLDSLAERIDRVAPPQETEHAVDLLTALEGEPDDLGAQEPQQPVAPETPRDEQIGDPAAQQQIEELRSFVRAEAEQIAAPILERERRRELATIERQFPDITSKPVMDKLRPLMAEMAEEAGTDSVIDNPTFLRMAYRAVKAELADAGAVPAEEAAAAGASLETNAGQAQVGGPDSVEDQYKKLVYGTPRKAEF